MSTFDIKAKPGDLIKFTERQLVVGVKEYLDDYIERYIDEAVNEFRRKMYEKAAERVGNIAIRLSKRCNITAHGPFLSIEVNMKDLLKEKL